MMVGREVNFKIEKEEKEAGQVVLDVQHLNVKNAKGVLGLKDFSLQVRAGEIVGIAGIDGNGQTELAHALSGLAKAESGTILLNGEDITKATVRQRFDKGMGHIPEDRHKHGLILDFTLKENMIIHEYDRAPYCKGTMIQQKEMDRYAQHLIDEFDVRSGEGIDSLTRSMSGGNQQKAIIAREIDRSPDLLMVVQPTRGLDVGAIEYIHKRIVEERDKGKAVLLISFELDEILGLSDQIVVLFDGHRNGSMKASETNENELGLYMSGSKKGSEQHEE